MCGRYAASTSVEEIVEEFEVAVVNEDVPREPRYNVAPTDTVRAVVERRDKTSGEVIRKLAGLRWGLVPSWAKQKSAVGSLINARSESVAEKPSFRKAFAQRRCLIPADGYFEWYGYEVAGKKLKQPFFIHPLDEQTFAMAGVYEFWKTPEGNWLTSCAIITTTAADNLGVIHDRMPMTVTDRNAWLDPHLTHPSAAQALLTTVPMEGYAVSKSVGFMRNDYPSLIEPIPTDLRMAELTHLR